MSEEKISVACPECGKRMKAPLSAVGKMAKCGACGTRFRIEVPVPAEPSLDAHGMDESPEEPSDALANADGHNDEVAESEDWGVEERETDMDEIKTKSTARKEPVKVSSDKEIYADEVSSDSLLSDFRGRSIISVLLFTLLVHGVIIGGTSIGYLKREILGEDTSELSKEERLEAAVREGTTELKKIADRYGINPQDLTGQFTDGVKRKTLVKKSPTQGESAKVQQPDNNAVTDQSEQDTPTSAIEQELKKQEKGPELPSLEPDPEKEDDLF